MARRRRRARRTRSIAAAALVVSLAGGFGAADYVAGAMQQAALDRRRALKARLDRMAFHDLRTGIDDIAFVAPDSYRFDLHLQNAGAAPFYVMLPSVEAMIQVGWGWQAVPTVPVDAAPARVIELADDVATGHAATIATEEYAVNLPGYMHVKLVIEALVSPEENPQEEIGERREDIVLYLRDARLPPERPHQPSFIPLRAWTLVPRSRS